MKIELDLNDEMVEALVNLKHTLGAGATIADAARHALEQGLDLENDDEGGDGIALPEDMPEALAQMLGQLGSKVGRTSGVIGVKVGSDGKMEFAGMDDLPDEIKALGERLVQGIIGSSEDDCQCENCVARRAAAEKPKNFS